MLRIKLIVVALGVAGVVLGYQDLRKSKGSSSVPDHFELAALESGKRPMGNRHLSIGPHTALLSHGVSYGEQSADGQSTGQIDYMVYPAISSEHAFDQQLAAVAENPFPLKPVEGVVLLVKTYRYKQDAQVPFPFTSVPAVTGLVMPGADPLGSEMMGLLKQDLPDLNPARVIVLEEGAKPSSMLFSFGVMGLGVLGALAGIAWLFKKS